MSPRAAGYAHIFNHLKNNIFEQAGSKPAIKSPNAKTSATQDAKQSKLAASKSKPKLKLPQKDKRQLTIVQIGKSPQAVEPKRKQRPITKYIKPKQLAVKSEGGGTDGEPDRNGAKETQDIAAKRDTSSTSPKNQQAKKRKLAAAADEVKKEADKEAEADDQVAPAQASQVSTDSDATEFRSPAAPRKRAAEDPADVPTDQIKIKKETVCSTEGCTGTLSTYAKRRK